MKYQVTQIFLLLSVVAASVSTPDQSGRSFYLSYTSPHKEDYSTPGQPDLIQTGQHFIPALVSDARQKMNLGLSTQLQEIALFEKGFTTCNVPNPYDKSLSKSYNDTHQDALSWDILLERNTYRLQNVTALGNDLQEEFRFQVAEYEREVFLNLTFFEVYQCTPAMTSAFDGLLGLQQYQTQDQSKWPYNFLHQLKYPVSGSGNEQMIDNMVVMVYAKTASEGIVKIGSWDQSALASGQSLFMLKTSGMVNWSILCSKITYAGVTIVEAPTASSQTGHVKYVEFSPELPYLYMPLADFSHWAFNLQSTLIYTSDHKVTCDYNVDQEGYSYCRFLSACSEIPSKTIEFSLYDDTGTQLPLRTNTRDFLVDGENFGHQKNTHCYIPAFRYGLGNEHDTVQQNNTWYAGSLVWSSYALVFDNTPYDSHQQSYSSIGIGVKNQADSGISNHYEQSGPSGMQDWIPANYNVQSATSDMSHHTGSWTEELITPINVPPKPAPPPPPPPPVPPTFLEKYWIECAVGGVALLICMYCTFRACTYKSPKTYYNAMYSIAQDNPLKMRIQ